MTEVSPSTLAVEAVTLTLNEKIDFSNELEEVSSTSVPFLEPHPSGVDASQGNEKTVDSPISILIIGGGNGGIGSLLGLLAVPEEYRKNWTIDVVEKRDNVAGVWYPQNDITDSVLPDTPLYPLLHTNTPVTSMAFPNIPYPPGTALYPSHDAIRSYYESTVKSHDLDKYIHLEHNVLGAEYAKNKWNVEIQHGGERKTNHYDKLIVASGKYKYPYSPTWTGSEDWLKSGDREIVHSLWYRGPEKYAGRVVIVIGFGGSGLDIANQTSKFASEVYHSYDPRAEDSILAKNFPPVKGTVTKPRISHFTLHEVVFVDGTTISSSSVSILLATGYELLAPYLKNLSVGTLKPSTTELTTNKKYIRPLHHTLFAADSRIPTNALAFIALPFFIANAPTAYLQGLFIGHAYADRDGEFLPPLETILKDLKEREDVVRADGFEPLEVGNLLYHPAQPIAYHELLFTLLRTRSKIPLPPYLSHRTHFVEEWRKVGPKFFFLRKAWKRDRKSVV